MAAVVPLAMIDDERLDRALRDAVDAFEAAFPGRVRGYYVEGSHADRTGVTSSDLDLTIVFRDRFADDGERDRAAALATTCTDSGGVELDIVFLEEAALAGGADPMFKLASRLVYGEDIRDTVPLLSIDAWTRDRMHAAYWLLVKALDRPPVVRFPLGYPEPTAPFRGYDRRMVRLPDGRTAPSTRNLIRVAGWMGTALVALQAGRYVARKRDCHASYREWIGDEWAPLLEEIYVVCRGAWGGLIPDAEEERRRLDGICERMLAFENHFVERYQQYLVSQLRGADREGVRAALQVLARIPLLDPEVIGALRELERVPDEELGRLARTTFAQYDAL